MTSDTPSHTPPTPSSNPHTVLPHPPDGTEPQRPGTRWAQKVANWMGREGLAGGISRRFARLGQRVARAERQVTERFRVPPGGG